MLKPEDAKIDDILNDLVTYVAAESDSLPNYVISGSGWGWFLDPEKNQMVRVSRGSEIVPLPGETDTLDRCLVRSDYRFLLIPESEVQEIGWN
jgi:hypothetical protein